jgi:hypothetical protein
MHKGGIAAAGIVILAAAGLSACDGGPETTGSTTPPAVQGEETPTQAMPAPPEGQDTAPASEGTNSGG